MTGLFHIKEISNDYHFNHDHYFPNLIEIIFILLTPFGILWRLGLNHKGKNVYGVWIDF